MITDRDLDVRTTTLLGEYVSRKAWLHTDAVDAFRNATRAALEVDRESLKLLEMCRETQIVSESLDAHITTLRKRLGLNT